MDKVIKWNLFRLNCCVCVRLASQIEPLALFSLVANWYNQFVAKLSTPRIYKKFKSFLSVTIEAKSICSLMQNRGEKNLDELHLYVCLQSYLNYTYIRRKVAVTRSENYAASDITGFKSQKMYIIFNKAVKYKKTTYRRCSNSGTIYITSGKIFLSAHVLYEYTCLFLTFFGLTFDQQLNSQKNYIYFVIFQTVFLITSQFLVRFVPFRFFR